MKVEWMVSCQESRWRDGRLDLLAIYVGNKPIWHPGHESYPLAVAAKVVHEEGDPSETTVIAKLESPHGKYQNLGKPFTFKVGLAYSIIEFSGPINIPEPGDYSVVLSVGGQHVEDAPSLTLRFVRRPDDWPRPRA